MISLPQPIFETNFENGSLIDKVSSKAWTSGIKLVKLGKSYALNSSITSGLIPNFKIAPLFTIVINQTYPKSLTYPLILNGYSTLGYLRVGTNGNGTINFAYQNLVGSEAGVTTGAIFTINKPNCFVFSINCSGGWYFYVNGVLAYNVNNVSMLPIAGNPISVSASNYAIYYKIKFYNIMLNAQQAQQEYINSLNLYSPNSPVYIPQTMLQNI